MDDLQEWRKGGEAARRLTPRRLFRRAESGRSGALAALRRDRADHGGGADLTAPTARKTEETRPHLAPSPGVCLTGRTAAGIGGRTEHRTSDPSGHAAHRRSAAGHLLTSSSWPSSSSSGSWPSPPSDCRPPIITAIGLPPPPIIAAIGLTELRRRGACPSPAHRRSMASEAAASTVTASSRRGELFEAGHRRLLDSAPTAPLPR